MSLSPSSNRVHSIDILRGIVMVIMALDHTRDYFTGFAFNPTDLDHASTPMFLTRWITHFCAPVFIFLSGTSAFLYGRNKTKGDTSRFLLTRGLWLIFLEFTFIRFGWFFNLDYDLVMLQVIWAIGWSMIALAGLVYLPKPAILTISLLMIFGHNLLDGVPENSFGKLTPLWNWLHDPAPFVYAKGHTVFFLYTLIPWAGVMAAGYCFGHLFTLQPSVRHKYFLRIGLSAILLFLVIRGINIYGDPRPWEVREDITRTALSFIDCSKYPPSLLYLLMTIGPAITILPLLEGTGNMVSRFFTVFGKVPMFYYILHIYLLHSMVLITASWQGVPLHYFNESDAIFAAKPGWGFTLVQVYLLWMLCIAILYFPSRWFMGVKARNKSWWLSYL